MGFGNSYKVLSPLSWETTAARQGGSPPGNGSSGSAARSKRVVDFVKRWLLCGWNVGASEYSEVVSPGNPLKNSASRGSPGAGADCYVRPPRWKQFLRRVRARSRKVQAACCEGLCFHPQQQPLNYCSTDSYERNFDRGREFWSDDFGVPDKNPTFAAPASYATTLRPTSSSTPILWEEKPLQDNLVPAPIWQRRLVTDHLTPIAVGAA